MILEVIEHDSDLFKVGIKHAYGLGRSSKQQNEIIEMVSCPLGMDGSSETLLKGLIDRNIKHYKIVEFVLIDPSYLIEAREYVEERLYYIVRVVVKIVENDGK